MKAAWQAQILWDYQRMHCESRNTDIAIGLSSHDIGVPEHTAALYLLGRFLIVFTGANAPITVDVSPETKPFTTLNDRTARRS